MKRVVCRVLFTSEKRKVNMYIINTFNLFIDMISRISDADFAEQIIHLFSLTHHAKRLLRLQEKLE